VEYWNAQSIYDPSPAHTCATVVGTWMWFTIKRDFFDTAHTRSIRRSGMGPFGPMGLAATTTRESGVCP
jgi:hypothetical protein